MQVATNSILAKTGRVITVGVRNASCDRGWLQIFTHIVCGVFTVTSFVMILVVSLNLSKTGRNIEASRCQLSGCRVICHEAPFYEDYEDDILLAVMAAEEVCQNVFLTLHEPIFTNESLPQNWLTRLRPMVVELHISGGNLHHIPQNTFSAAFSRSLRLLIFEEITIASWTQNALMGLVNLENICIKKCNIINMQENILSAVSQSLLTLTVTESGFWNPQNLTGSLKSTSLSMLTSVDLSHNDYGANLGKASFTRLRFCKSLYLGSNRISYIEPGAFENLVNLEYLNLNNNLLKLIEPGLFQIMTPSSLRLNLGHNLWHCNCSDKGLRQLTKQVILLIDPICSSPKGAEGKTFNEFITYCKENEPKQIVSFNMGRINEGNEGTSLQNLECVTKRSPQLTPRVISPFHDYPCSVNVLNYSRSQFPSSVNNSYYTNEFFWLKPVITFIGDNFTMIELSLSNDEGYGLIWYRNSCLNEVFCVNMLPDTIRLYNIEIYNEYTFCPIILPSGTVDSNQCIGVSSDRTISRSSLMIRYVLIPLIAVFCLFFGALTLYILIRKYPYLLKGSKRLLFVKHKTVDALVLPPKVPLRGLHSSHQSYDNSKDFLDISASLRHDFVRSGSVRSCHSIAPSYISALQPTEEQLESWRCKLANKRFDNHYATISTISSDMRTSLSSDSEHLYFSIEDDSFNVSIIDPFTQNSGNEAVSVSELESKSRC